MTFAVYDANGTEELITTARTIQFPFEFSYNRFPPDDIGQSYTAGSHIAITDDAISNTKPAPTFVIGNATLPNIQEVEFRECGFYDF